MNPKLRNTIFKTYLIMFLLFISCSSSNTKKIVEDKTCNENLAFKKVFFENIQNIENLETKSQNDSFHKSLKFISKYAKVNYEAMLNYSRSYPYGIFEKDKAGWLKWYEENKCNNIQFKD